MTSPKRPRSHEARPTEPMDPPSLLPISGGMIAGICIGVSLGVLGIGLLIYSMITKDIPAPVNASDAAASKPRKTRTASHLDQDSFLSSKEKVLREAEAQQAVPKADAPPVQVPMEPQVKTQGPWDRTLKTLGGYLTVPARVQNVAAVVAPTPSVLTQIHVVEPQAIHLKIHSASDDSSKELAEGFIIKVQDEETHTGLLRRWIVQRLVQHPVTKTVTTYEIATFALADQDLTFQWDMQAPAWTAPNSLLHCVLELSNADESHKLRLSQPSFAEALKYDLTGRDQRIYLDVRSNAVKDPASLFLDLELHGVAAEPFVKNRMRVDDAVIFSIQKPNIKLGDPKIEFEIRFGYDDRYGPHLALDAYTTRTQLAPIMAKDFLQLHAVPVVSVREPTFISHFEKIKNDANNEIAKMHRSQQYKDGVVKLAELNQRLNSLERTAASEPDVRKRNELNDEIRKMKAIINVVNEVVKREQVLEDVITWAEDMGPYFLELRKTARVEYTLYTEIQGEKIILARTHSPDPSPSNDTPEPKP